VARILGYGFHIDGGLLLTEPWRPDPLDKSAAKNSFFAVAPFRHFPPNHQNHPVLPAKTILNYFTPYDARLHMGAAKLIRKVHL
jgi:hypothetical protein